MEDSVSGAPQQAPSHRPGSESSPGPSGPAQCPVSLGLHYTLVAPSASNIATPALRTFNVLKLTPEL